MDRKFLLSIVLLATAFAPLIEGGTTHLPVFILKVLVIAASAGFLYSLYIQPPARIYRTGYELPFIALTLAVIVSVAIAPSKYMAFIWVQLIVIYFIFFNVETWAFRETKGAFRYVAYAVLCVGALQAAVGYYQYAAGDSRINGTFFNPNMMAGYVSACICMAVSLGIWAGGRSGEGLMRAGLLYAYSAACVMAVILSGSRGGILALAAGLSVVLWYRFRFLALAAAGLIVAGVLIIPNPVKERVFSVDKDTNAYKRLEIWKSAANRIEDHPLGLGLGNFKYYSDIYAIPVEEAVVKYGTTARTAHNEYLHFTAEAGFLGAAAIAYLLFALVQMLNRTVKQNRGRPEFPVIAGATGGIAALLTHSLVDSNLHEPGIVFLLITFVALCSACSGEAGAVEIPRKSSVRVLVAGALALGLLGVWGTLPYLGYLYNEKSGLASKEGRYYTAYEYAGKAVSCQPFNADYYSGKAAACFALFTRDRNQSMLDESLGLLLEAERLNPLNSRYPLLRSYVLSEGAKLAKDEAARSSMLQEALAASGRAVELSPFRADPAYNRAVILVQLHRLDEAEKGLERVASLEPNHMKSRLLLAKIYGVTGRGELSMETARSIINNYQRLTSGPLDETGRSFIHVDLDEVESMANASRS